MSDQIWMKHADHGGIALLPDLSQWRALGWEPTDERPAEPDTLRDPGVEPEPAEVPEVDEGPEDSSGPSAVPPVKSAKTWMKTEESESDR